MNEDQKRSGAVGSGGPELAQDNDTAKDDSDPDKDSSTVPVTGTLVPPSLMKSWGGSWETSSWISVTVTVGPVFGYIFNNDLEAWLCPERQSLIL